MTRSSSSLLFWVGMVIVASLMLYHTSDRVNELDRHLRAINAEIDSEQQSLHVLKAEWVYLSNPARIEAEAARHLSLRPTDLNRITSLQAMSDLLPLQNGESEIAQRQEPGQEAAPVQTAETEPGAAAPLPHTRHERMLAALNTGHINDRMILQHASAKSEASLLAKPDKIGALINSLGMAQ